MLKKRINSTFEYLANNITEFGVIGREITPTSLDLHSIDTVLTVNYLEKMYLVINAGDNNVKMNTKILYDYVNLNTMDVKIYEGGTGTDAVLTDINIQSTNRNEPLLIGLSVKQGIGTQIDGTPLLLNGQFLTLWTPLFDSKDYILKQNTNYFIEISNIGDGYYDSTIPTQTNINAQINITTIQP